MLKLPDANSVPGNAGKNPFGPSTTGENGPALLIAEEIAPVDKYQ